MTCRRLLVLVCALAAMAGDLGAQAAVTLRIAPRLGDTLHLRLDQEMEMRGRTSAAGDTARFMATSLRVMARVVPTAAAGGVTTLTTITDSVIVGPNPAAQFLPPARHPLEGSRAQVRVLPDGAMELADPAEHDDAASPLLGNMPPVLPRGPVRPGDRWTREMRLPMRGSRGGPASVRAIFRLDSLSRDGRIAFISVRGAFYERPHGSGGRERELEGSLTGVLEFNRDLGWITDSHTTITMSSEVRPPDARSAPMQVWMRVTQRLQTTSPR